MTRREYESLPRELASGLRSLDLRVRALAALRGVGFLCAVVGTAIAVGLLIDWLADVGVAARTGLLLGVIGATVVTFLVAIIGPLLRRISANELAALVDDAYPELGERIESVVELSDPNIPERDRGSLLMRSRLREESVRRSKQVNFGRAAASASAVRWAGIGALTLVLLLAPFGLSRDGYGLLLTRFLNPWRNLERATNLYFFIGRGDRTVARGSDVTIVAAPRWRIVKTSPPDHAWLHWRYADGESDARRMEFDADSGTFRATIPQVLTSFDYDISAGRVQTRTYRIDVVAAPAIEQFTLEIAPPAYTGLPARRQDSPVGRIEAFEQSRLTFHLEFSKPVVSAALTWGNAGPDAADPAATDIDTADPDAEPASPEQSASLPQDALAATLADDGRSGMLIMTADRAGPFRIELRDQRGVGNLDNETWELVIVADQPPAIEWADAAGGLPQQDATIAARPQDNLPLPVVATDDVGVAELELHAEVVQRSEPLEPLAADATWFGRTTVDHTFSWDLSQLPLQDGDLLSVRARAVDGRPVPGPQEAWTASRLIRITSDAESIEKSLLAEKQRRLRAILEAVREHVQEDRETTETLRNAAREATDQQQPPAPQQEIAQLAEREQKLTQRLDQLAAVFSEHPLRRNMAEQTREVGTGPLSEAGEQFQQAASAPPAEQLEPLTNAADELARAEEQLDELLDQFDELAALEQDLQRLQKLAENAEQLADNVADFEQQQQQLENAEELAEEQRQARENALSQQQEKLQTDQQVLTDELDRLLEDRPEVLEAATERQQERLQELSEQASRLADREDRLAAALEQEPKTQEPQPSESPAEPKPPSGTDSDADTDADTDTDDRPSDETGGKTAPEQPSPPSNSTETEPSHDDNQPSPTDSPSAPTEEDITRQQQQLAEEAARLALETARNRGVESPSAQQAREFAENSLRAAEEAQTGLLSDAAQSAENATDAARQAAEQLQDPTDPAPTPLQEQAAALAEQQASLAERLRHQSESPAARQQAQADGQRQLAKQTNGLSEQLQEIAERLGAEPLNNAEESGHVDAAQQSAEQATAAMQQAQQELEQGQSGEASPQARAAAEALRQTARQAGQTAEANESDESSPVPGEVGEQVVDARRQLQQAGEKLRQNEQAQASNESADGNQNSEEQSTSETTEPPVDSDQPSEQPSDDSSGDPSEADDTQTAENAESSTQPQPNGEPQNPSSETDASQSLQQVAQSLRDAAQQLGMSPPPSDRKGKPSEQPGEPSAGDPGSESGDSGTNPISLTELETELKRMSRRDWGKLPGRVESELFQSAQKKPASDYARLIHLYFEEISRRRTATESLTPNDNDL